MEETKEESKFRSISLSKELVDKVELYVIKNKEYRSLSEFFAEAARLRLEQLSKEV